MAAPKMPRGLEELLRASPSDSGDPAPGTPVAPRTAKVHRRGRDAVLDTDDVEIIVYELFPDRA